MKYLALIFFLLLPFLSSGQLNWKGNKYELSSSVFVSSDSTLPFWMRSQSFGEVPIESQFVQLKASLHNDYDSTYNREQQLKPIDVGYGTTLVGNLGLINQAVLSEAYVKMRWKVFELWAGRRKEIIGLVDSTLSSGSLIWGQNAVPLPKIQVSIPNYTPIIGKGLISVKGSFAHGWFGSTDSVKNYFLHQKTFYTKIGRPEWRFHFFAGINHQVQWGGRPTVPFFDSKTDQIITNFPGGLGTYLQVISGVSLNRKGDQTNGTNGVPFNEAFNRVGNHLGTVDIAFQYNLSPKFSILGYRQSIYEDGSLFYLNNISDGLTGFTIKNQLSRKYGINRFNIEYLKTTSQGGPTGSGNTIPELRGLDNYFNNGLYEDGWTYRSRGLGNAFLLPVGEYSSIIPSGGQINQNIIYNNRLEMIHLSLNGRMDKVHFVLRYALSQNQGRYGFDLGSLRQSHISIRLQNSRGPYTLQCHLASDFGDFLGNNIGANFMVKRLLFD